MYYRNAQSALVVYDITKPTSFIKARHWVNELKAQASPGIVIALVGNKLDLVKNDKKAKKSVVDAGDDDEEDATTADNAHDEDDDEDDDAVVRKVAKEEGQQLADSEGLLFFETSAKSGLHVRDVFLSIAGKIPEESAKRSVGGAGGASSGGRGGADAVNGGRLDLTANNGSGSAQGCQC